MTVVATWEARIDVISAKTQQKDANILLAMVGAGVEGRRPLVALASNIATTSTVMHAGSIVHKTAQVAGPEFPLLPLLPLLLPLLSPPLLPLPWTLRLPLLPKNLPPQTHVLRMVGSHGANAHEVAGEAHSHESIQTTTTARHRQGRASKRIALPPNARRVSKANLKMLLKNLSHANLALKTGALGTCAHKNVGLDSGAASVVNWWTMTKMVSVTKIGQHS